MRLDQALTRISAEVVTQRQDAGGATLMIRMRGDLGAWADAIREVLLVQENLADKRWSVDISRAYFLDKSSQTVRFLWRIILRGDVKEAAESFGMSIIRCLSEGVEVTSQPLVGRVSQKPGSTKGAHSLSVGPAVVASHFSPGMKQ